MFIVIKKSMNIYIVLFFKMYLCEKSSSISLNYYFILCYIYVWFIDVGKYMYIKYNSNEIRVS